MALVTGASHGIGAATAQVLASRGAHVAVSARTVSDLEHLVTKIRKAGGQGLVVPCDVMEAEQIEHMVAKVVDEWGRLDILVNNAGKGSPGIPVERISPEEWDHSMILNLKSAFLCIRAVAPVMKRQGYGRIVNVSSRAGRNYGRMTAPQYGAAKAGMIGLTRHMAVELGPFGICVNAVAPGLVMSERVKAQFEVLNEEGRRKITMNVPLHRLAEPEEIATAIAFLASDDASYVNGVSLDVNGGAYMA
jgi:3-oxoacyl-[acyl-carrier protein] reductase